MMAMRPEAGAALASLAEEAAMAAAESLRKERREGLWDIDEGRGNRVGWLSLSWVVIHAADAAQCCAMNDSWDGIVVTHFATTEWMSLSAF